MENRLPDRREVSGSNEGRNACLRLPIRAVGLILTVMITGAVLSMAAWKDTRGVWTVNLPGVKSVGIDKAEDAGYLTARGRSDVASIAYGSRYQSRPMLIHLKRESVKSSAAMPDSHRAIAAIEDGVNFPTSRHFSEAK